MTSDQSAGPPDAVAEIMELAMNLAGENAGSAIMTLTFGSSDALIERRDTAYAALEAAVTKLVEERDIMRSVVDAVDTYWGDWTLQSHRNVRLVLEAYREATPPQATP